MDGPRDYHTKQYKSDKDKYHILSLIQNLKKMIQNNLIIQHRLTDTENFYLPKGKGGKRDKLGIGD